MSERLRDVKIRYQNKDRSNKTFNVAQIEVWRYRSQKRCCRSCWWRRVFERECGVENGCRVHQAMGVWSPRWNRTARHGSSTVNSCNSTRHSFKMELQWQINRSLRVASDDHCREYVLRSECDMLPRIIFWTSSESRDLGIIEQWWVECPSFHRLSNFGDSRIQGALSCNSDSLKGWRFRNPIWDMRLFLPEECQQPIT